MSEGKKLRVKSIEELILWALKPPRIMIAVVLGRMAMIQRKIFKE